MTLRFPTCIRVVFDEYGVHVPYAATLAEALHIPLIVHIPIDQEATETAGQLLTSSPHALYREMLGSVSAWTRKYFTQQNDSLLSIAFTPIAQTYTEEEIIVSCDTSTYRAQHVLSPGGELRVFRNKKGPVLIPLGNGSASIFAASHGVLLAKRLDTSVLFWHTTWRREDEESNEPRKHVCATAAAVISEAERIATAANVAHDHTRIECADTIVEGIIRVALYSGASLVVMTHGTRKRFGAYPDRVRSRNCPVPLLILSQGQS